MGKGKSMNCEGCRGAGKVLNGDGWRLCVLCKGHGELEGAEEPGYNCQINWRIDYAPGSQGATSKLVSMEIEATGGARAEANTVVNVLLCLAEDIMAEFRRLHGLALLGIAPVTNQE